MKICIVSEYYKPDSFLINEIAPELVSLGHEVTVLTGLPDYKTGRVPKDFSFFRRRYEIDNGVEIYRMPIIARRKGAFFRVLNYLSFMLSSSLFAFFWRNKFDIVMTYQMSPITQAVAGKVIQWKQKIPHLIYCMDLWPASVNAWGFYEGSIVYKVAHWLSRKIYANVDRIAISSRPFENYLVEVNEIPRERIVYLPQHSSSLEIKKKRNTNGTVNLIFAGNIGSVQNIECLIRSVEKIDTKKKYLIHIYGDGSSLQKCIELTKEKHLESIIKFYGRVPKEKLVEIYSEMDGLILTLASEKTAGAIATTVPSKFQNYLSTGKPIIASIDGGAAEIIREIKCGLVAKADDDDEFSKVLKEFIENKEKYTEAGIKGKKYFNDNYRKEIFISRLSDIFIEMTR